MSERIVSLAYLVRRMGYKLVIDPEPWNREDLLGDAEIDPDTAQMCKDKVIAVPEDSWTFAYSVAHEIAEFKNGFNGHTEKVWTDQCNILANWITIMGPMLDVVTVVGAKKKRVARKGKKR